MCGAWEDINLRTALEAQRSNNPLRRIAAASLVSQGGVDDWDKSTSIHITSARNAAGIVGVDQRFNRAGTIR
jgi:hypothetical protein